VPAGSIGDRLAGSEDEVLQIALVDWVASLPLIRVGGRAAVLLAAMAIGCVPAVACAIEYLAGGSVRWFVWTTAAVYGVLIAFMNFVARRSWHNVIDLGMGVDAILDGQDRQTVMRWLNRALGQAPQLLALAFGALFSGWVGIELTGPIGHRYLGDAAAAYVFTIGWTGGVGAIMVYWLWGAPALFHPLAQTDRPKLDWIAPLQTPAVQMASRLIIDSARAAAVGLLLFTIPISITLALASKSWPVWVFSMSPLAFSLVTILGCSILPQIALEDLVRRGKSQTLAKIRPHLPSPDDAFRSPKGEVLSAIAFYERIAEAPVSVVDWRRFVEYLFLLLSGIVPIVIALLTS